MNWFSWNLFFEVVDGGFRWTSGSSGVFKARSLSLQEQAFLFLGSQIQEEHSIEHLLNCFILLLIAQFLRTKLLKQQHQLRVVPASSNFHFEYDYTPTIVFKHSLVACIYWFWYCARPRRFLHMCKSTLWGSLILAC